MTQKRKRLSLKDKINIIAKSDRYGLSSRKLAEKYGVRKTQINDIIKNKSDLKQNKSKKEDPLVIGKSMNPRYFKGSHVDKLQISWIMPSHILKFH